MIFGESNFSRTLKDLSRYKEYFFAYQCYNRLNVIERKFPKESNNPYGVVNFGQALRYGKYAVVAVCNALSEDNDLSTVNNLVDATLADWLNFEAYCTSLRINNRYFRFYQDPETGKDLQDLNYTGYYKGRTLNTDLENYFFNYSDK